MKQVYLNLFGIWSDVVAECDTFILARDADGVMCYVLRDGQEQVRVVE